MYNFKLKLLQIQNGEGKDISPAGGSTAGYFFVDTKLSVCNFYLNSNLKPEDFFPEENREPH